MSPVRINSNGFTFVEVMIAGALFVFCAVAAITLAQGSVKSVRDAQEVTKATWLLEQVIVDLETKMEVEGVDKACEKKKEGKFEAPFENFGYVTTCEQIDFHMSEATAQMMGTKPDDKGSDVSQEDMVKKMVLEQASTYMSKAMKELHAEVYWVQGKNKRKIDVTTHFARYDLPFQVPSLGGTN